MVYGFGHRILHYDLLSQGQGHSILLPGTAPFQWKGQTGVISRLHNAEICEDSGGYDWLLRVRGQGY